MVPLRERLKTSEERHTTETVMAVLILMCASETWLLTKRSLQSTELTELRSVTPAKGCHIIDKILSDDIRSKLGKKIKIQINKPNWLQCMERIGNFLLLWLHGTFILTLSFLMEKHNCRNASSTINQ